MKGSLGLEGAARDRERGVALLVGIGIVAAAASILWPAPTSRAPRSSPAFVFSNVRVIAPQIRDASRVNVNAATEEELATLPGIGEALASRIVAYRAQHGPFARIEDLDAVSGIGPSLIERIRDLATVVEVAGESP